jgi:hypothetical protein
MEKDCTDTIKAISEQIINGFFMRNLPTIFSVHYRSDFLLFPLPFMEMPTAVFI